MGIQRAAQLRADVRYTNALSVALDPLVLLFQSIPISLDDALHCDVRDTAPTSTVSMTAPRSR